MDVYKKGGVALANAPGTGIADDKVHLCLCAKDHRVLHGRENNHSQCADLYLRRGRRPFCTSFRIWIELVVKAVNESGGYGMLVGPHTHGR